MSDFLPRDEEPSTGRTARIFDVIGTVVRLALGGLMVYAGYLKLLDLDASARAVLAYQVMPHWASDIVGTVVPVVEVIFGILLILGLFTRTAAMFMALLFVIFMVGIAQAWARGLTIDCGCFGGGGKVAAAETRYGYELLRDTGLLLAALYLVWRPRSLLSLDSKLYS